VAQHKQQPAHAGAPVTLRLDEMRGTRMDVGALAQDHLGNQMGAPLRARNPEREVRRANGFRWKLRRET